MSLNSILLCVAAEKTGSYYEGWTDVKSTWSIHRRELQITPTWRKGEMPDIALGLFLISSPERWQVPIASSTSFRNTWRTLVGTISPSMFTSAWCHCHRLLINCSTCSHCCRPLGSLRGQESLAPCRVLVPPAPLPGLPVPGQTFHWDCDEELAGGQNLESGKEREWVWVLDSGGHRNPQEADLLNRAAS